MNDTHEQDIFSHFDIELIPGDGVQVLVRQVEPVGPFELLECGQVMLDLTLESDAIEVGSGVVHHEKSISRDRN